MTKVNEYDILVISNKERQKGVIKMKLVTIKLNGLYIATTEMTISNIRKAEKAGFTITTK